MHPRIRSLVSASVVAALCLIAVGASAGPGSGRLPELIAQAPPQPVAPATGGLRRVTLSLKSVKLREALKLLFDDRDEQYEIAVSVPNPSIKLELRDVRFDQALVLIVRQAAAADPGIRLRNEAGIYRITFDAPRPKPQPGEAAVRLSPQGERLISVTFKDVPLRRAVELIFNGTGFQYVIDPNVPDVPITLRLEDVSLQQALRLLIRHAAKQIPGLTQSRGG